MKFYMSPKKIISILGIIVSISLIVSISNAATMPSDPGFPSQGYLVDEGNPYSLDYSGIVEEMSDIQDIIPAEGDYTAQVTIDPVIVAVLDTGLDWTHEDLYSYGRLGDYNLKMRTGTSIAINEIEHNGFFGKNAPIIALITWFMDTFLGIDEIPFWGPWSFKAANNGKDDDGNGYVDDVIGWDFVDNDNDPMDNWLFPHGTGVAGVLAPVCNNGKGICGLTSNWGKEKAWAIKILPIRVNSALVETNPGDMAKAIKYAINRGAKVISISSTCGFLPYPGSDLQKEVMVDENGKMLLDENGKPIPRPPYSEGVRLVDALQYAKEKGVIIVQAAGNSNTDLDSIEEDPLFNEVKEMLDTLNLKGFSELTPEQEAIILDIYSRDDNGGLLWLLFKKLFDKPEYYKYGNPWMKEIIGEDPNLYPNENGENSWQEYGKIDNMLSDDFPYKDLLDNIIVVASTDEYGRKKANSCYGKKSVDIAAPGTNIRTLKPRGYTDSGQTSLATPHVSGAVALIMAHYPELDAATVKEIILDTNPDHNVVIPDETLQDKVRTGGRLNIVGALKRARVVAGEL